MHVAAKLLDAASSAEPRLGCLWKEGKEMEPKFPSLIRDISGMRFRSCTNGCYAGHLLTRKIRAQKQVQNFVMNTMHITHKQSKFHPRTACNKRFLTTSVKDLIIRISLACIENFKVSNINQGRQNKVIESCVRLGRQIYVEVFLLRVQGHADPKILKASGERLVGVAFLWFPVMYLGLNPAKIILLAQIASGPHM